MSQAAKPDDDGSLDELVRRFKSTGDREAFETLWKHVEPAIRGVFRAKTFTRALNEEETAGLANEVAIVVLRKRGTIPGTTMAVFRNWVFAIQNKIQLKANRHRTLFMNLPESFRGADATVSRLVRDQEWGEVKLNQLGGEDSKVLRQYYFDSLTVKGIADSEGVSLAAVKQRLSRARKRLRDLVEGEEKEGKP
ncbi:hypothetical protein GC176_24630 [bacterium]|nr:hypothetical protein [bacterium]